MARRTREVSIPKDDPNNRDGGKLFILTEMPATQAELWAFRLFLGLARAGIDVPDNIRQLGMAGIAIMGFKAIGGLSLEDAKDLLGEMFGACVAFVPDASDRGTYRGARIVDLGNPIGRLMEEDIEEISTRLTLRKEVFDLHTGFFSSAARSNSASATAATGAGSHKS